MRDVGLMKGVKALWQEDLLWDYTINVEGQQFKAHKVVLASVSKYFKAVLGDGFMESKVDEIELKGLSADIISKVLEFIYTGEEDIITTDMFEVLKCAMYLQMSSVVDVCVEKMLEGLHHKNCLELYTIFIDYSFREAIETVENFIKIKWKAVFELCNIKEISVLALHILKKYWQRSEWEMFLFIKDWFEADPENRKDDMSELLTDIRFCLINPQRLQCVTELGVLTNVEGPWHDLVEQALHYHQLPTHRKVLEQSDQSKVRTDLSPTFFTTEDASTFYALNAKNKWKKYDKKAQNRPEFGEHEQPIGIEVNNYFIICTGKYGGQKWYIFDPRTLKWSEMADMEKFRRGFDLLHHGEHLYAVGGSTRPTCHGVWVPSYEMELYSYTQNAWSSVAIPYSFRHHAACILGNKLYVSGGYIRHVNQEETLRCMYSLDLSSPNREWERKADFRLWESLMDHKMVVVCMDDEDVLLVVLEDMQMHYYSPAKDHWFRFRFEYTGEKKYRESYLSIEGMLPAQDNCLYILNVQLFCWSSDASESESEEEAENLKDRTCLKWKLSTRGKHVTNILVENFPLSPRPSDEPDVIYFAASLAFPH